MMAQSTVEYALVGALVVIAAATAMTALGTDVTAVFNKISTTLGAAK
jgi:Flp pilus assembly pilin Flp